MQLPLITPMKLGRRAEPFDDPAWIYELKWDGFRTLAIIDHGRCQLWSRNGNRFKRWKELSSSLCRLQVTSAILDGEVVCLDCDGKADFKALLFRRGDPVFYGFDLLWVNGVDLRDRPLVARKDCLRVVLNEAPPGVRYVDHIEGGSGKRFFELCCEHDLEGVVAKRLDSTYLDHDHEIAWLKIKNCNYSQAVDRHELFEK
jgi:bifunctional non-homologous end joining protein LigD